MSDTPDANAAPRPAAEEPRSLARLRLYIAGSTPNSVRAQDNLSATLSMLDVSLPPADLEVIDVFIQARRAITDGVSVTPTLIGVKAGKRIVLVGDLADRKLLQRTLQHLMLEACLSV